MYSIISKEYIGKSILHIGDNEHSDCTMAEKNGIKSYKIMSAYDMLCASAVAYISYETKTLGDRLLLANVLAKFFNSPFTLNKTLGRVPLNTYQKIAYWCFLPITISFMQFIIKEIEKRVDKKTAILFTSRDGYFLYKLYRALNKNKSAKAFYFYTSRKAATGAASVTEDDIAVMCSDLKDVGTRNLKTILEERFQIPVPDEFDTDIDETVKMYGENNLLQKIKPLTNEIIEASVKRRSNYQKYIQKSGIADFDNYVCIDTVSRGTVTYAIKRITGKPTLLLACFGHSLPNSYIPKHSDYRLLFGNTNCCSKLASATQFMEMIYASQEGQCLGFDKSGDVLFDENSKYNPLMLKEVQGALNEGVLDYMRNEYISHELSYEFIEAMFCVLQDKNSSISDYVKDGFVFFDSLSDNVRKNIMKDEIDVD